MLNTTCGHIICQRETRCIMAETVGATSHRKPYSTLREGLARPSHQVPGQHSAHGHVFAHTMTLGDYNYYGCVAECPTRTTTLQHVSTGLAYTGPLGTAVAE